MGSLFSKPKTPDPPPVIEAPPVPEVAEGDEVKKLKKRKGKLDTVLTGDLVPAATGHTALGGRI